MYRLSQNYLAKWLFAENRKPLVLRGARQVGKSFLIRAFAKEQKIRLIEINVEKNRVSLSPPAISIEKLIRQIEVEYDFNRTDKNILIFFDEVQEQIDLIKYLRYFYEEYPQIPVVAAGSLLEIFLEKAKISVPVGRVEYLHLGPMSFGEYLLAKDNKNLFAAWESKNPENITLEIHQKLISIVKEFMIVGGMPASIGKFIKTSSYKATQAIGRDILQTYDDDFLKYSEFTQADKMRKIVRFVAQNCGQKVKYSEIDALSKSRDLQRCIDLLSLAKIVIPVFHTNATGVPLKAQEDTSVFKLFGLDVGLLSNLLEMGSLDHESSELLGLVKGALAEQFVAQHLYYRNFHSVPSLNYWLKDKSSSKAEIDFIISHDGKVIPLEVKAEKTGSMKSLIHFLAEKKLNFGVKITSEQYKISEHSHHTSHSDTPVKVDFKLLNLPIYWVEFVDDFLQC